MKLLLFDVIPRPEDDDGWDKKDDDTGSRQEKVVYRNTISFCAEVFASRD